MTTLNHSKLALSQLIIKRFHTLTFLLPQNGKMVQNPGLGRDNHGPMPTWPGAFNRKKKTMQNTPGLLRTPSWTKAYGPSAKPEIAMAVMIESPKCVLDCGATIQLQIDIRILRIFRRRHPVTPRNVDSLQNLERGAWVYLQV